MHMKNFTPAESANWIYRDSAQKVMARGGKILERGYVKSFSDFDIGRRYHQTRQRGEDRGHIDDLIGSIESVGLQHAPTVKYDAITGKYQPLGGHHRIISINKMLVNKDSTGSSKFAQGFPVLVVGFTDTMQEEFFKVDDNNHQPTKTHSIADVVDFFVRIDGKGHFGAMDERAAKKEIYKIIDNTFSHLGSQKTKNRIFNSWFYQRGNSNIRSAYPSSEELYEEARVHWHLPSDSDQWRLNKKSATRSPFNKNDCLVIGPENSTRKTFINALTDGLLSGETYSYKFFISLGCGAKSIPKARARILKRKRAWNLDQKGRHQITEIVFRGQLDKETHQRHVWDKKSKTFVIK